jgi:hypothetical protein
MTFCSFEFKGYDMEPFTIVLGTVAARSIGRYLAKKMSGSPPEKCVVCGDPKQHLTNCCTAPMCQYHFRQWMEDPNPCPCKRR